MSDKAQPNALGLEFSQPDQGQEERSPASAVHASPGLDAAQQPKRKELVYVNPDRVRTGGTQKVDYFLYVFYYECDTQLAFRTS